MIDIAPVGETDHVYDQLFHRNQELEHEKQALIDENDLLRQEAQMHAQKARTHRTTAHEIYQIITGGQGEPGNWQRDQQHADLPNQAARVFVSITQEDAHRLAERKWMRFAEQGVTPATQGSRDEVLAQWVEHIYGDGNQPYAVSRAEYLRRQAERSAAALPEPGDSHE